MRLAQVMAHAFERHPDRPAVGERAREFVRDDRTGRVSVRLLPRYETTTYRQLWSRVQAVASEWHHHSRSPLVAGDRVALLGFSSRDYATLNLACAHLGAVMAPLQSSAATGQLISIMAEAEPSLVAASAERLGTATELSLRTPSVRRLVVFDHHPLVEDQAERFAAARDSLARAGRDVEVVALSEVLDRGAALPDAPPYIPGDDEDPSRYSSTPRGARERPRARCTPSGWPG